jgi:hypothetical protein
MASRKGTSLLVLQTASSAFRMLRERARAGNPRSAWVACRKRPTHKSLVILSGVRRGGRSRRTCGCSCLCISRDRSRTDRPVFLSPVFLFPASTPRSIARAYAIAYPRTLHTRKGHLKPPLCHIFGRSAGPHPCESRAEIGNLVQHPAPPTGTACNRA